MPPKPKLPGPLVDSGCSTTIVTDPARIDPASLRLSSTVITGVGSTLRSQGSGTATITLPTASGAAVPLRLPAELIPEAQCDLLSLGAITDNNYVAVLGPSGFPSSLVRSDSPLLTSLHERIAQDTSRIPLLRMPNSTWTLPPATDTAAPAAFTATAPVVPGTSPLSHAQGHLGRAQLKNTASALDVPPALDAPSPVARCPLCSLGKISKAPVNKRIPRPLRASAPFQFYHTDATGVKNPVSPRQPLLFYFH